MKYALPLLVAMVWTMSAQAAVKTELVEYKQGDITMQGFLAWDDAVKGRRPGVLIVHDWMGEGEFDRQQAKRLAELGYTAFSADIYGRGVRPKDMAEAGQLAGKYKGDRKLLRDRVNAAFDVLKKQPTVDPKRTAAIGFCFGGTTALELARGGADVTGVVSFHGGLDNPTPADAQNIRAHVLVLHGADDPFSPLTEVNAFMDEMRKTKADWQVNLYSGAVHAFTNPAVGNDSSKGIAYNQKAAERSWEAMKLFFKEIFK
jgi:dienelactone hydrolase